MTAYGLILEKQDFLFRTLSWFNSSLCNYTFAQENASLCLSGGYFSINAPHIEAVKMPDLNKLNEAKLKKIMATPNIIDGRNIYNPAAARALGFTYLGVGR